MTVKELIFDLKRHDPNMQVILQKDAEGNGYSPLSGCDWVMYVPGSNEVYDETDDLPNGARKVVVLWPV